MLPPLPPQVTEEEVRARLLSSEGSFEETEYDPSADPPPLGTVELRDKHGRPFRLSADGLVERRRPDGSTLNGSTLIGPLQGLRSLVRGVSDGTPREPLLPTGTPKGSGKKDW